MKHMRILATLLLTVLTFSACDAFRTLDSSTLKSAQGRPYELIVVASQPIWEGELGDSLRAVLAAPIDYLPQREPEFDTCLPLPACFQALTGFGAGLGSIPESPHPNRASEDRGAAGYLCACVGVAAGTGI